MLLRVLLALLIVGMPGHAAARVVIHATCAAGVTSEAAHTQRLRATLERALAGVPAARNLTLDVALVRLDTTSAGGEVEVRAEVRGVLSEKGRMRFTSTSRAKARGTARDLALVKRDAIEGAADQLARALRNQAR